MDLHECFAHHESGHFRSRPGWETARANPSDHLVIWAVAGGMEITVAKELYPVEPGDLVVLDPGRPHRYRPTASTGWEWMWLHFGGLTAPGLTARLRGTSGIPVRQLGVDAEIRARFTELVAAGNPNTATPRSTLQLHLDSCGLSLLGLMIRRVELRGSAGPTSGISELTSWILDNLDRPFGLPDLARASGWSPAHLSRLVRRSSGMSPMAYAARLRMRHAERLLRDSDLSVGTIAGMVGFDDPLHFSRRFRQLTGHAPTAYRVSMSAVRS
ncbi:MAG TPA: AraC family transcriptional regulator [Propionibacteriaceae bacterium]|nr:AraC family transcriptional regulator [Propionibacteriaceae bacterium]